MARALHAVAFAGTGAALPEKVVTNADLARLVETDDEWIASRTGIRERRVVERGKEATTDLALGAAQRALEAAEIAPADLELIVVATCTPDYGGMPATAPLLAGRLGAPRAYGFDVSLACSGFLAALLAAEKFIATGAAANALVVGADCMSAIVDWRDRSTCVIFGDGAGAAVLRPAREGEGEIVWGSLGAEGNDRCLVVPAGGSLAPASHETVEGGLHFMKMKGRETFRFAVERLEGGVRAAAEAAGRAPRDLDLIVPHQVNLRIIEAAMERAGVPLEKVAIDIDRYGNTSAASVPIALDGAVRAGRVKRGDLICLVAFGAGLAWGSALVRW
jgi:3-oxoacyl-[acyl-carrier-protein] synthase-3